MDALSASGLRTIRFLKELENVKCLYANDISASSHKLMKENFQLNQLDETKIKSNFPLFNFSDPGGREQTALRIREQKGAGARGGPGPVRLGSAVPGLGRGRGPGRHAAVRDLH